MTAELSRVCQIWPRFRRCPYSVNPFLGKIDGIMVESKAKTLSESLFEEYLSSNGYRDWSYEPQIGEQSKHPDYLLRQAGVESLFEVKELRQKSPPPDGFVNVDPYRSIRKKIHEARIKFQRLKDYCCSLVVCNIDDWETALDPEVVFGAMLGDLGLSMDFDPSAGRLVPGTERNTFLNGGKMIRQKTGEPQNTTISAIVVLERYRIPDSEFDNAVRQEIARREESTQQSLSADERAKVRFEMYSSHTLKTREVPRVRVVENPVARIPFPEELFRGELDEHWQLLASPQRTFAGSLLHDIERAEEDRL